jgi:hypothetical protein
LLLRFGFIYLPNAEIGELAGLGMLPPFGRAAQQRSIAAIIPPLQTRVIIARKCYSGLVRLITFGRVRRHEPLNEAYNNSPNRSVKNQVINVFS